MTCSLKVTPVMRVLNFERLRIIQHHTKDPLARELPEFSQTDNFGGEEHVPSRNPLIGFLEANNLDEEEKDQLNIPVYRQDPLLRQLKLHPEDYKEDFLELPSRKQDTLLKILKKNGVPRWEIDRLTPPDYEQNPLLRLLHHNNQDNRDKNNLKVPKMLNDPVFKDLLEEPEEFTEDFSELQDDDKIELVEIIELVDDGTFEMERLIPNRIERLEIERSKPTSSSTSSFENLINTPNFGKNPLQKIFVSRLYPLKF